MNRVAVHKTRELANIKHFYDEMHYHTLEAGFVGRFHDVTGMGATTDFLLPDVGRRLPGRPIVGSEASCGRFSWVDLPFGK